MRIKTLVLLSLVAVLVATVNSNLRQTSLPTGQQNISANAPQKIKLEQISPEIVLLDEHILQRGETGASRSKSNKLPAPDISYAQNYAYSYMGENYGWGKEQHECLIYLWEKESGWRYNAENKSSGAYGIPQSLPASKMSSAGLDWKTNPETQIKWGLGYIKDRYNDPCGAWTAFKNKGWY